MDQGVRISRAAEDLAAEVREEHGRIPPVVQVLPASRIGKPSQYWTQTRHFTLATVDRTAAATATEQQIRKWWELQRGDAALVGAQGSLSVQARGA